MFAGRTFHSPASTPIPALAGIGLKPEYYADILAGLPPLGFLEVHAENYMGDGGPPHRYLTQLREYYPFSFHGVGMSLGGVASLDQDHLDRWKSWWIATSRRWCLNILPGLPMKGRHSTTFCPFPIL